MTCNKYQNAIERQLVESLDPGLQQQLDAHLLECASCHTFARTAQETIALASSPIVPEMPETYWATFYDGVEARIVAEDEQTQITRPQPNIHWAGFWNRLVPQRRFAIPFALAAAVLVIGIMIGRVLFSSDPVVEVQQVATNDDRLDPAFEIVPASLNQRTDRFIGRSKVLLLGMVNMDLAETTSGDVNLGSTRLVAHELVKESGSLRNELELADEQRLMKLIDDLEVILLQIANLEEDIDIPAIELVKDGVDKRAVLLKINVSEMRSNMRGDGS